MVENLIQNGSFESVISSRGVENATVLAATAAPASRVPGWHSLNGEAIEIWGHGFNGVGAGSGRHFLDLDYLGGARPLDGIYQDVQTEAGKTYVLRFDIRARTGGAPIVDESVVVEWNGAKLATNGYHAKSSANWYTYELTVTGTGGIDRLTFREIGTGSDGHGPFLDHVQLIDTAELDQTPDGQGFSTELIVEGLVQPIGFAVAPDGRIFVAEKAGVVKVAQNGQIIGTFLDINEEVNSFHDRGLLGIALDPEFAENGHVYLQYTVDLNPDNPDEEDKRTPGSGRLIRVSADDDNPNVADPSTRIVVQDGHEQSNSTHSVGDIDFDNDGNLIFTWGDGGFHPRLRLKSQDPTSPQGKLFRIDRETFEGIPDNPYYDADDPNSYQSRVWAIGIRNSWKMDVDRETGDVYIGEVTDHGPEEINVVRADGSTLLNFGWPYFEDNIPTPETHGTPPAGFEYTRPLVALPHTEAGGGDSVTGGAVIRGNAYSSVYEGRYIFANFNQGIFYTADQDGNFQQFGQQGLVNGPVDIQLGPDGHIWVMSLFTGEIVRLVSDAPTSTNNAPQAVAAASHTAGYGEVAVVFDASTSTDGNGDPLIYNWDFDSDGRTDATGATAQHTYNSIGRHTATLTVSDSRGGQDTAKVEVTVVDPAADNGNMAFGVGAVTQSGVSYGGLASRAVDGNTDGDYFNGSVALTRETRTPLWEIDLGEVKDIGKIKLYSRTDDGTAGQLTDYWLLISKVPFSSGNVDAARVDPGVWAENYAGGDAAMQEIDANTEGRYVRIQRTAQLEYLPLAELEIFAPVPAAAPEQTAAAGSVIEVHANGRDGREVMELLIDGDVVAVYENVPTSGAVFTYTAAQSVTAGQVSVAFTNDRWEPAQNIDYNLTVDKIVVDGVVYETEDTSVQVEGRAINGDRLLTNGAFHYADIEADDVIAQIDAELQWL